MKKSEANARRDKVFLAVGAVIAVVFYGTLMADSKTGSKAEKVRPPRDLSVYSVPLDTHGTVMGKLKGNLGVVNEMVGFVKSNGYRCDTISEAREAIGGGKLFLKCNNFRYHYEIVDRGGKIEVNVAN